MLPVYGNNITVFTVSSFLLFFFVFSNTRPTLLFDHSHCCFFGGIESDSVKAAGANLVALGVDAVFVDLSVVPSSPNSGCDNHPNVQTRIFLYFHY